MTDFYSEYFNHRQTWKPGIWLMRRYHKFLLDLAARHIIIKDKTFFEIGVGHGIFAQLCKDLHFPYFGIEQNREQADKLFKMGLDVFPGDTSSPFDLSTDDITWLCHVLEHTTDYEAAKQMLVEIGQNIYKGGHIVIIAPDYLDWGVNFYNGDWSHGYPTTVKRVGQLLRECGFEVVFATRIIYPFSGTAPVWLYGLVLKLIPITLLDMIFKAITGMELATKFFETFGWKQVFIIGKKG